MSYFTQIGQTEPKELGELFDYNVFIPGEFGNKAVKLVNGCAYNGNVHLAVEDPTTGEIVDIFNPTLIMDKDKNSLYRDVLAAL